MEHWKKEKWNKDLGKIFILILIYVLVANARSIQENPYIPEAVLAVNMAVPVIAGILFGRRAGFLTGVAGTLLNALILFSTQQEAWLLEVIAILPHGIMGWSAAWIREILPTPVPSFAVIIGSLLTTGIAALLGRIPLASFTQVEFWQGLGYEALIIIITVIIIVEIFRLSFED